VRQELCMPVRHDNRGHRSRAAGQSAFGGSL
jgi:hypothetical protein